MASVASFKGRGAAVCTCITCASLEAVAWSRTQAARAKREQRGDSLPPLSRETFRFGEGGDCPDCDGLGRVHCEPCNGSGEGPGWNSSSNCGACRGEGVRGDCERCDGDGVLHYRRCDQCGHMAEARDLHADGMMADRLGLVGGGHVCDDCIDCSGCMSWVHMDVADDEERCLGCQAKARSEAEAAYDRKVLALLPEWCASGRDAS